MGDPGPASASDEGKGRTTRVFKFVGLAAGAIAAVVGLAFQIDPKLSPCLGGTDAAFDGALVLPHVGHRQYLLENGRSGTEAAQVPDDSGADVNFSYHTDSLRGRALTVRWSLVTVGRDGTLGGVVAGEDRNIATVINPDACSQTASTELFVPIPSRGSRYEVILELDGNAGLNDRRAVTQTPIFRG